MLLHVSNLTRQLKMSEILFDNLDTERDWKQSFYRYKEDAAVRRVLRTRLIFAETWMKFMQFQLEKGILDPDVAYVRTKRYLHSHPSIEDLLFIRGVVVSHWAYGQDFIRVTSEKEGAEQQDEIKDLKRRYYFSLEEYETKTKEREALRRHFQ